MTLRIFLAGSTPALLLGLLLGASACSQKAGSQATKPPVAVETVRATTADFEQNIEVVGTLKPKAEAEVKSEYTGTVSEILVSEWIPVRKGQVLARLDSREAKAQLLQVQAEAARADRERWAGRGADVNGQPLDGMWAWTNS